jgi:SpoVK/Ycf46/Vps4 family AAA+-type ATPase
MDIKKIFGAITSLVPFWSNNIVSYFGFGSEYAMTINIILTQFIQLMENNFNEKLVMALLGIGIIILLTNKLGYSLTDILKLKKINSIVVSGFEDVKDTNNTTYPITMEALTNLFIDKHKLTNIIVNTDLNAKLSIGNLSNHKLDTDLFLTVTRLNGTVTYELKSYTHNLQQIVSNAINDYTKQNYKNSLTLYGKEDDNTYDYPSQMIHLTYVLFTKYKMPKTIVKSYISLNAEQNRNDNKNDFGNKDNNATKQNIVKNVCLIDDCNNYCLEDDLYITIRRMKNITKYILWSNSVDLKKFIDSATTYYDTNLGSRYKYRISISGTETSSDRSGNNSTPGIKPDYPDLMFALNHNIVTKHNINSYKYIINKDGDLVNKYILNGLTNLQFDDIYLTINKYTNSTSWFTLTEVEYVLESNTVDVKEYLDACLKEYEIYCKNITKGNIYHFVLTKFSNNSPEFNMEILSEPNKEIFQTFANIHNEHKKNLIGDLKRLKDLTYYKRTGLKRKKSYLFYGEPGCGKTQTVLAIALEDNRHIIEIPFNIIKNNLQLEAIMNIKSINNVQFNKNEIIYLFDEIDTACTLNRSEEVINTSTNISTNSQNQQNQQTDQNNINNSLTSALMIAHALKDNAPLPNIESNDTSKLNIGNILSKLDGIGNYDGVIIVATTNYKDRLDPALYRELRLTPMYFTYLRQSDAIEIIEKFFQTTLCQELLVKIPDRKITPAKLVFLCEKYETMNVDDFVKNIILGLN